MPSKKRARSEADESSNRAECPFTVRQQVPTSQELARHQEKKSRRDAPEEDKKAEWHWQNSPFAPVGFTKSSESMDIRFAIDPMQKWSDMTRYNSFVLGKEKFHTDDYVFVANEESLKRQKNNETGANGVAIRRANNDWVAKILEIRASDEQHAYARVFWMYWPDELPAGTYVGRKTIRGGRQPYHGRHELIASNHMDVINAVSVTMAADVNHWVETDEEDSQAALYWRQAYNCNTGQLSSAKDVCKCETPANPDKVLIRCSSAECGAWLHPDCLRHDALTRVYERLGRKEPQIFEEAWKEIKMKEEDGLALPQETDIEKKENDVKPRLPLFVGSRPPIIDRIPPKKGGAKTPKTAAKSEPYKGLFEAVIDLENSPTAWQVEDLRTDVDGSKTWLEQAYCLCCNRVID